MASNKSVEYHQQWIGYLNPIGLVFSPHALDDAQAVINEGVISEQKEFHALVIKTESDNSEFTGFENIRDLFIKVLNWRESDLNSDKSLIAQYSFSHPQFGEVVSPTWVAKLTEEKVMLVQKLDQEEFDKTANTEDAWNSSPHFKFERLLREKQVSTGIIVHKEKLRLIFAPRGESSGYVDFPFKIMYQPSGRLVFAAFRELLSDAKIFNSPKGQSLIEILELSRKYQAQVSIDLSGQVLAALYELLRGFQTANDDESGKLLERTLKENPQLIYEGLLTTLLRMVFIMYAEDRNLLATDEVYQGSYALAGLYERLRQDEAQNPDTMDSRYGAWAHLISLFRLVYDGAEYDSEKGKVVLPARHGHLFDPDIYIFLEGRDSIDQSYNKAPKISDGVVFRVLKNLLVLKGERISYRTLDVEQIGSVYETMMGFELGIAKGETIALKPAKSHGAPLPINLDEILSSKDKAKMLGEVSELKLSDKVKIEFNECNTIEDLVKILGKRIDERATPFILSKGAMVLAPSEARRKSGSHYTPRELTEPIVRTALEPILKNLGEKPTPEQILELKICDPAMGSGAFLVEACRQLSEKLVESWGAYKIKIAIGADEDELLHARRLIAQKCLYGVDRNHMAVNLAKLSLWLVTLAKDHSFSFLDHNLKYGDSLVGLTNKQIMAFDFADREELPLFQHVKDQLIEALEARDEIINATDEQNYDALKLVEAEYLERLEPLRLVGNLALKCYFDGKNEKQRSKNLVEHSLKISNYFSANDYDRLENYCREKLNNIDSRFVPFHWELEFPEVFTREYSGFDCFVGNPPFQGKNNIINSNLDGYTDWLKDLHRDSHGNSDIVAHFFRRAFVLLRDGGAIGLIATNTIRQGDTRSSGLEFICQNGGSIYHAVRRLRWPGAAAVVVSVVHIFKGSYVGQRTLDKRTVDQITAFLFHDGGHSSPNVLSSNKDKSFQGSILLGLGYTFDDTDNTGKANSISDYNRLIKQNPKNAERIFPLIGGKEIYDDPKQSYYRYAINFFDMSLEEASQWPDLISILKERVKPERDVQKRDALRDRWWQYAEKRPGLYNSISKNKRVLVNALYCTHLSFVFLPANYIYNNKLNVMPFEGIYDFAVLQSRLHDIWAWFFSSTLKDDLAYAPTDCFETFPFPLNYQTNTSLIEAGENYYLKRAQIMTLNNEGLTKTYNRFHDPNENSAIITELRKLHEVLDSEVLNAYGWNDLELKYDFILDYEEEDDDTANKKKPFRYKFTPELHDELLARLMKLNHERYEEEVRLGLHKR